MEKRGSSGRADDVLEIFCLCALMEAMSMSALGKPSESRSAPCMPGSSGNCATRMASSCSEASRLAYKSFNLCFSWSAMETNSRPMFVSVLGSSLD